MAHSVTRTGYFIVDRSSNYPLAKKQLETLCSSKNLDFEVISGYQGEVPKPGYFTTILPIRLVKAHQRIATRQRKEIASSPSIATRSRSRFNPSRDQIKLRLRRAQLIRPGGSITPLPVREAKMLIAAHSLANIGHGIFAIPTAR